MYCLWYSLVKLSFVTNPGTAVILILKMCCPTNNPDLEASLRGVTCN
jgi:hypothetical protein